MRPRITVLGAGSWGTTLASMCARRGPTMIWALEDEVIGRQSYEVKRHRPGGYSESVLLVGCEAHRLLPSVSCATANSLAGSRVNVRKTAKWLGCAALGLTAFPRAIACSSVKSARAVVVLFSPFA